MRHVDLLGTGGAAVAKLTGHLNARMAELVEDGLTLSCQENRVAIAFPGLDSATACSKLAQFGIVAGAEGGQVVFTVTDRVSHEDLDYVQGAVMEILYG